MKTNPNDSAHPEVFTDDKFSKTNGAVYSDTYSTGGLTKREYFAAMALQGLLASVKEEWELRGIDFGETAVMHADSLIAGLNKNVLNTGKPTEHDTTGN